MKGRPWYKRYPGDFLNGVAGLGPAEIGCYAVILEMIYDRGGPVPADTRMIAGLLGCSTRLAGALVGRLLEVGKLIHTPQGWTNIRAEIELVKLCHLHDSHVFRGSKGGRVRAINAGETLHYNDIAQARLKHVRASRSQIERKRKEDGSAGQEASKEASKEEILVSSSLASRYTNGRAH